MKLNYRSADKFLPGPGRKQATATKLLILQATQKKKDTENCPSNRVSAATMISASDEKWPPFDCFFHSGRTKDLLAPCNLYTILNLIQIKIN